MLPYKNVTFGDLELSSFRNIQSFRNDKIIFQHTKRASMLPYKNVTFGDIELSSFLDIQSFRNDEIIFQHTKRVYQPSEFDETCLIFCILGIWL